jgi:hypothetical protein
VRRRGLIAAILTAGDHGSLASPLLTHQGTGRAGRSSRGRPGPEARTLIAGCYHGIARRILSVSKVVVLTLGLAAACGTLLAVVWTLGGRPRGAPTLPDPAASPRAGDGLVVTPPDPAPVREPAREQEQAAEPLTPEEAPELAGPARATDAPPSGVEVAGGTAADWEEEFRDADLTRLRAAEEELDRRITQVAQPEFMRRFDQGDCEVLGFGTSITGEHWDETLVMAIRMEPIESGGRISRVVLSENEFPQLYALKAKQLWLRKRIRELPSHGP